MSDAMSEFQHAHPIVPVDLTRKLFSDNGAEMTGNVIRQFGIHLPDFQVLRYDSAADVYVIRHAPQRSGDDDKFLHARV